MHARPNEMLLIDGAVFALRSWFSTTLWLEDMLFSSWWRITTCVGQIITYTIHLLLFLITFPFAGRETLQTTLAMTRLSFPCLKEC